MKIAIISRGRTNSTAIGITLAHHNHCEWMDEHYVYDIEKLYRWVKYRPKYDKSVSLKKFQQVIQSNTDNLFTRDNFVTKIFPSMLCFPPHFMYEHTSFDHIKNNFIFNLNILNLEQYDKLYFLDRSLMDSVISWVYAFKAGNFHTFKIGNRLHYKQQLDVNDFARAKFYILNYFMQKKIKNYLDLQNKSYVYINELSYDQYIDIDCLPTKKNEINYQNYILNINEFKEFINYWYPIIEFETKDWNFY